MRNDDLRTDWLPNYRALRPLACGFMAAIGLVLVTEASSLELARLEASNIPPPGVIRVPLPPIEVEGLPLALVFYDLKGTAGIAGGDARARSKMA